jgi:hypothetical protein
VIQNFDFTEALLPAAMRWLAADVDEDDIHKICALTLANTMSSMPQGDLARFADANHVSSLARLLENSSDGAVSLAAWVVLSAIASLSSSGTPILLS